MRKLLINLLSPRRLLIGSILAISALTHVRAESLTNHLFTTKLYDLFPNTYLDIETSKVQFLEILNTREGCKYGHELLPAAEDPEGNWGMPTNGIQLSIRFYQTNFTNGQPVSAVALWRNAGDSSVGLAIARGVEYYPFDFVLHHNGNLEKPSAPRLDPNWEEHYMGGPSPLIVQPWNQIRYLIRLDKIFDLKPGAYEVSAKRDNAESGTAKFWVFPKAETQTNGVVEVK